MAERKKWNNPLAPKALNHTRKVCGSKEPSLHRQASQAIDTARSNKHERVLNTTFVAELKQLNADL